MDLGEMWTWIRCGCRRDMDLDETWDARGSPVLCQHLRVKEK